MVVPFAVFALPDLDDDYAWRGSMSGPSNIAKNPEIFREFEYAGWQRAVDHYHAAWGALTSQCGATLLDELAVGRRTHFLDIATGPGYVAGIAVEREAIVTAIDFSPTMVRKAKTLHPTVDFLEGDAQHLDFENDSFDAVGINFGILHFAAPEIAIREAFRVLKPGGRFAFTVWANPDRSLGFSLILRAVDEHGEYAGLPHGPDFFYYSRQEACKAAVDKVGFREPNVTILDLVWKLPSIEDVFPAFYEGTARTGGLLRHQTSQARAAIENQVRQSTAEFLTTTGEIQIPMAAVLTSAYKP